MNDKIGRREFLEKATLAALAVPVVLEGGLKQGRAIAQTTTEMKGSGAKMKKICIEEHWRTPEVGEIGINGGKEQKFPSRTTRRRLPRYFPA